MIDEDLLIIVRQRLGLGERDTSRDAYIRGLSPRQILQHVVGWHLGDESWAATILDWARRAGYTITLPPDTN